MLLIFDWDGTLSDSTAKIATCMQHAVDDMGADVPTVDEVKEIIGLGLPEAIAQLFPNLDSEQREVIRQNYARHYMEADQTPSPFFPHVMDVLEELKVAGHTLAVATGKSRRGLNRVLDRLQMEKFFHASRCADETASKPHPLMLNELLQQFNSKPDEAVMVGDTEFDMEMAVNAKVARIAVSYGAHHVDRLKIYEPVLCMDRFDQMLDWI